MKHEHKLLLHVCTKSCYIQLWTHIWGYLLNTILIPRIRASYPSKATGECCYTVHVLVYCYLFHEATALKNFMVKRENIP